MTNQIRLGMLTPSSNTVLEPMTAAMLADVPGVTAHFGRFRVTEISLAAQALGQFDSVPLIEAAELLADARVQAISWNGTSAGWRGFETDERLCEQIKTATGIPASSSVLALNDILATTEVERLALVTPYLDEVQAKITANYEAAGFTIVAERHFGDRGNYSFAEFSETEIAAAIREVARAKPQAIVIFCTNLRGAPVVAALEEELDIPIYDTVATALWQALRQAGGEPNLVEGWGRLFQDVD